MVKLLKSRSCWDSQTSTKIKSGKEKNQVDKLKFIHKCFYVLLKNRSPYYEEGSNMKFLIKPEKPSDQFLSLIVMSHWLVEVWIRIRDVLVVLSLSLFHVENHVFLSRGVQVSGATWRAATRIVVRVGDLVQRTEDGHTGRVLDGWTIGRSGDVVCGLHCACGDEEHEFLGWASKPRSTVYQWFDFKTTRTVSLILTSKPVASDSPVWTSKLTAIWWFMPHNYHNGFLLWALKPNGLRFVGCITKPTEDENGSGHTSRSSSLLCVKASQARVF
jgi:hypothetical protein